MGSTLEMLQVQWARAMLDGDWAAVDRIDAARREIEALPVRKAEALPVRVCAWAGSEVCRHCEVPVCSVAGGAA